MISLPDVLEELAAGSQIGRQIDSPNVAEEGQALRTREICGCRGFAHQVVTAATTDSLS
jgi:hypothetical protein